MSVLRSGASAMPRDVVSSPKEYFCKNIHRFSSDLIILNRKWGPENVIALARSYITDLEDIIDRIEANGSISAPINATYVGNAQLVASYNTITDSATPPIVLFRGITRTSGTRPDISNAQLQHLLPVPQNPIAKTSQPSETLSEQPFEAFTFFPLQSSCNYEVPDTIDPRHFLQARPMSPQTTYRTAHDLQEGNTLPAPQNSAASSKRSRDRQTSRILPRKRTKTSQQANIEYLFNGISVRSAEENVNADWLNPESINLAPLLTKGHKLSEILIALDATEVILDSVGLARRILLVQVVEIHKSTKEAIKSNRDDGEIPLPSGTGPVASEALDMMVMEAYPGTVKEVEILPRSQWRQKYDSERKRIQNRIQAGKVWHRASREFSLGILVLFPRGDHYFESLDESHCQKLLDLLRKSDNDGIRARASQFDKLVISHASSLGITCACQTQMRALPGDCRIGTARSEAGC